MKLLFDANLSPTLVSYLRTYYPGSLHVRDIGLGAGSDAQIWEHARAEAFVIVSKDTDFRERSFVEGFPPKIVWRDLGKRRHDGDRRRLRDAQAAVAEFVADPDESLLVFSTDGRTV